MLSCSELSTSLSNIQATFDLKSFKNIFEVRTTSFDGRPLLTPSEFRCLFFQSQPKNVKSQRNRDSLNTPQYKMFTERTQSQLIAKNTRHSSKESKIIRQNPDLDEFENIQKRIKSEDSSSNPSTDCDSISETHPSSPNLSTICQTSEKELTEPQTKTGLPTLVNENIVKAVFDCDSEQIKFCIQQGNESSGNTYTSLTRDEVLQRDPKLLLYFYESHLQFTKRTEFNPRELRKD